MPSVYDYRPGHSVKGVNAQEVGEELERIRRDRGSLTPHLLVEEATPEDSPLHGCFEWDNDKAAHEFRLSQARRVIVSVRIISDPVQTIVPAFVSVKTPERGREYMPTMTALSTEELRARVLVEIKQFAESLQRRYANFKEVADLISNLRQQAG